jgi:hypothetical protein
LVLISVVKIAEINWLVFREQELKSGAKAPPFSLTASNRVGKCRIFLQTTNKAIIYSTIWIAGRLIFRCSFLKFAYTI